MELATHKTAVNYDPAGQRQAGDGSVYGSKTANQNVLTGLHFQTYASSFH
ncbi:hypothetical protein [Mesorhizobium sp. 43Arga]